MTNNAHDWRDILDSLGINVGFWLAGFAGGICSLASMKDLTRLQAILAVATSLCCAVYLTPLAVIKLSIVDPRAQYGAAFVIGLTGMKLVPLIQSVADRFLRTKAAAIAPPSAGDPQ